MRPSGKKLWYSIVSKILDNSLYASGAVLPTDFKYHKPTRICHQHDTISRDSDALVEHWLCRSVYRWQLAHSLFAVNSDPPYPAVLSQPQHSLQGGRCKVVCGAWG